MKIVDRLHRAGLIAVALTGCGACGAWGAWGPWGAAEAAVISYRFTTTVSMLNPAHASFPASLSAVSVGAPVVGTITYETTSPTAAAPPTPPYSLSTRYALSSVKYRLVVGGVLMNTWSGQASAYIWNNEQTTGAGINDGVIFTHAPTGGTIQMQLGNLLLPTSVLASEALPSASLTGLYLIEMSGVGGLGGAFLRTTAWSGLTLVPNCPGDITGEGQVDVTDLLGVIGAWGSTATGVSNPADVNDDSNVNVTDLLAIIGGWGPCP